MAFEENFEKPIGGESASWIRAAPGSADPFDDDGAFFHAIGGADFTRQLQSFDTYRKSFRFGKDGWLTAELSQRDWEKNGRPANSASLSNAKIGGASVALLEERDHHSGIIIRSTRPLPPVYRVEYKLVSINFGGSRHGVWSDSNSSNGYLKNGPKTRHPWPFGPSGEFKEPYAQWRDVTFANGFYYMGIVDYPDPFPHNNVFIHTHRKVAIDSYNVNEGATFQTCNPFDKTLYISQDNSVNVLFLTAGTMIESLPLAQSECKASLAGNAPIVSAAQLTPELMPAETYRFAIERHQGGYTLEIAGRFRYVGLKTYRFSRFFEQDQYPVWHYNQTAEEYDGRFDRSWSFTGQYGDVQAPHTWPKGSAYPDYFIIGDPHTNYYEGSAAITDIKLYYPSPVR